jgi:hypothetical protein
VTLDSLQHFFNQAAVQIRRELLDLAQHSADVESHANAEEGQGFDRTDGSEAPTTLLEWTEFHETVEALSYEDRELFNLLWYDGLTQADAASLLGITERTIKRHWKAACVRLYQATHGEPTPGSVGMTDHRLWDQLDRWEDLHRQHRGISPEELCRDCPDLLADCRQFLRALQATAWLREPGEDRDRPA